MPYAFNPHTYSYVYYPEGSAPPRFDTSGPEYMDGYSREYSNANPNSPFANQNGGMIGGEGEYDGPIYGPLENGAPPPFSNSFGDGRSEPTGSGGGGTSDAATDEGQNRDAFEYLSRLFESYGLGSLAPKILEYVQQGYGPDTISLMLQDTPEYKQRFKANETRSKNGLAVLSPAEYLSIERSYRQIMEAAGMPTGFYDDLSDFTSWIGSDVAPQEIQERVNLASRAVNNSDSSYLSTLREYGLGEGDLVAAMLDRDRALPLLQKTVREAEIGAEARRQGLTLAKPRAGYFESIGVDQQTAAQAYQTIGMALPTMEQLGDIYGDESYGQDTMEDELLGRSGLASERRRRLTTRETSAFSGSSAVGRQSLSGRSRGEF